MAKPVTELKPADVAQLKWQTFPAGPAGMWVKVLCHDPVTGNHTRLIRAEAGLRIREVRSHDFWEETYVIEGTIEERGIVYGPGSFTCYPPGHPHGPYSTSTGWLALEVVYYDPAQAAVGDDGG